MAHKTTTHWKGRMLFESDNPSGNTVLMDTTDHGIARQQGLSPKAMMLSSLAGCSGIDIVDILKKMKITDYRLQIDVVGELTDDHPKYYHNVDVDYYFSGRHIDEKKHKRAVELSVEKYCGVMEMFRKFANVNTKIHFQTQ
ncbi:OsmC family protein [Flavobacteriaceae bacterium]|uniref:OsmC family protein n=1 Tax=Formosa sp. Hel3_A1_48 TaxID=1336795 RepID=UPI00084E0C2E|nr:OsmC family protein [Formosa sp. Hel3_A1_48]MDC0950016.1 OsmC family protein [Flavobacteriaceae bacterium]